MTDITTNHLVKGEDLNHHSTLFAGRAAEWIIEAGYLAATEFVSTNSVVCARINDLRFYKPIHTGDRVRIDGKIVFAWRSRLISYISITVGAIQCVEAFITFVNVDEFGKPKHHGMQVEINSEEEKTLAEKAKIYSEAKN